MKEKWDGNVKRRNGKGNVNRGIWTENGRREFAKSFEQEDGGGGGKGEVGWEELRRRVEITLAKIGVERKRNVVRDW